jgi:hypothetical protein
VSEQLGISRVVLRSIDLKLESILDRWGGVMWTVFVWLRIGTGGQLL